MAQLEQITVGSNVTGLAGRESVMVVAVKWYGTSVLEVTFKNGKGELGNQLFMSLIDPDRFGGAARSGAHAVDVSDVMRRLVKEELLKFDGRPLFPAHFAEVRARKERMAEKTARGADTVIVTKNEILTALNKPEEFILALVEVDGNNIRTTYLKKPFTNAPDFSSRYVVYGMEDLLETAEVVLTRGEI